MKGEQVAAVDRNSLQSYQISQTLRLSYQNTCTEACMQTAEETVVLKSLKGGSVSWLFKSSFAPIATAIGVCYLHGRRLTLSRSPVNLGPGRRGVPVRFGTICYR